MCDPWMNSYFISIFTSFISSFLGSGLKRVNHLCFDTHGNFLLLPLLHPPSSLSLMAQIPVLRPKSQPWGPNLTFKVQTKALRSKTQQKGPDWNNKAEIGSQGRNLGLQARILALRLGLEPWGWILGFKTGNWALILQLERGWRRRRRRKRRRRRRRKFTYVKA